MRSGVKLLATPGLVLQLGDRLTVVGKAKQIEAVEKVVGNTVTRLKDPNLGAIFIGLVLGLLLGSVPVMLPGISVPVKLGLAGGPIIMGILIGRFGPQFHLVTYTTRSANLMLRGIGLSLFLACLGLDSGAHFVETLTDGDGLLWILLGFIVTIVPVVIMAIATSAAPAACSAGRWPTRWPSTTARRRFRATIRPWPTPRSIPSRCSRGW